MPALYAVRRTVPTDDRKTPDVRYAVYKPKGSPQGTTWTLNPAKASRWNTAEKATAVFFEIADLTSIHERFDVVAL